MPVVIDANNMILGRLATQVAEIILGKKAEVGGIGVDGKPTTVKVQPDDMVYIINADKCVITGHPGVTTQRYIQRMHIKTLTNPRRGPFHPRQPEAIVRRAVRGMIPWKKSNGKEAYRRLRVFVGTPEEASPSVALILPDASAADKLAKQITVGELARRISSYAKRVEA